MPFTDILTPFVEYGMLCPGSLRSFMIGKSAAGDAEIFNIEVCLAVSINGGRRGS